MKSNKKIRISCGVIGTLFSLAHLALAIYLICVMVKGKLDLSEYGIAGLVIAVFAVIGIILAIAVVIVASALGLYYLPASMVTIFAKSDKAVRIFSIINCVFIAFELLIEITFIFGTIVNGFRNGNYLAAFGGITLFFATVSWFALNIILAKKPKKIEEVNSPASTDGAQEK